MQSADLAFSLTASNGTISQTLIYPVSASLAELNGTHHNLKGNGAHMQTNGLQKHHVPFLMNCSEVFSLRKGRC